MISESVGKLINEQIQKEFYSAYLYISFEAYFTSRNLNGFAHWFRVQSMEERDHANECRRRNNPIESRGQSGLFAYNSIKPLIFLCIFHTDRKT